MSVRWVMSIWILCFTVGCASAPTPKTTDPAAVKAAKKSERVARLEVPGVPTVKVAGKRGERPVTRGGGPRVQVSVLVFSDFECPFCRRADGTIKKLLEHYGERLEFVFMHHPLAFHKLAFDIAVLAMAADRQDKFWPVHDKLMGSKGRLTKDRVIEALVTAAVDFKTLKKDLSTREIPNFVNKSRRIAMAIGATGTPTFYINGKKLTGAQPLSSFTTVIDGELAAANASGLSGKAWIMERVKVNHPKLHGYIYGGVKPPVPTPPKPVRPKAKLSKDAYRVVVFGRDAAIGPKDAPVTLVTFSDFQCPYCSRMAGLKDKLVKRFGSTLRIVYKHLPLDFHKDARPAAIASVCAQRQGKFWPYHDALYRNQRALKSKDLLSYAKAVGLDVQRFKRCIVLKAQDRWVNDDVNMAESVGVQGTPTLFINGRKVNGPLEFEVLSGLVKTAHAEAKKLRKQGIAARDLYDHIVKQGKVWSRLGEKVHRFDLKSAATLGDLRRAVMKVVVFSDFECPFCQRIAGPLKKLKAHYGRKMSLTFKHFPLSFHKQAKVAAAATICAQAQGKFWALHDKIFEAKERFNPKKLRDWALEVGVEKKAFDACLANPATAKRIKTDMAEASRAGLTGTPTIYINGRRFKFRGGFTIRAFDKILKVIRRGK